MDYLPLAVQAFSVWLRQEVERPEANAASMMKRWSIELDDDFVGEVASGHRAINATVRLALHNIGSRFSELDEACRQLLGLLSLCRPMQVPWSLFDGVSLVSAIGQICKVYRDDGNGGSVLDVAEITSDEVVDGSHIVLLQGNKRLVVTASSVFFGPNILGMVVKDSRYKLQLLSSQTYTRGRAVEVVGEPLQFVCPTGELCRVQKRQANEELVVQHAVVASNKVIKGGESVCVQLDYGKREFVERSCISFGPEVASMVVLNGCYMLQLQQPRLAAGNVHIMINSKYHQKDKRGKQALLLSNCIVEGCIRVKLCDDKDRKEFLLPKEYAKFPSHVHIMDDLLVLDPDLSVHPSTPRNPIGRIVKYHRTNPLQDDPDNDTVTVVFGCETGDCRMQPTFAIVLNFVQGL